nr:DsrH/TusB family sulfur metabolism protein [Candidatus Sigynarchaeota archaeon]
MSKKLYLAGNLACEHCHGGGIINLLMLQQESGISGSDQHVHLIQDAVVIAKVGNILESSVKQLLRGGTRISVQQEDIKARGSFQLIDGIDVVSYHGLIDLIFELEKICSSI